MTELILPMLAEPGALPPSDEEGGWAYEMKWDGVRATLYVNRRLVRVLARSGRDVTAAYPEIYELAELLDGEELVLDGEIVAFDNQGRPDFGLLQQRMHVTDAPQVQRLVRDVPVTFLAFDVLRRHGELLLRQPYDARRALLESLQLRGPRWQTPPVFLGGGEPALQTSKAAGLEGIVAKRRSSPYEPGRRSSHWRKVKTVRMQEVVIGGWKPGEGRRQGGMGSLLLGVPTDRGLAFAGHVGTGFTDGVLADMTRRLQPLARATSPFDDEVPRQYARLARWVAPVLVGEVAFHGWTRDGRLRHPAWRGLREDKRAEDVVRETW